MTLITILVNTSLTVSVVAFLLLLLSSAISLADPETWEQKMEKFRVASGLMLLLTPIVWTITAIAFIWTS